MNKKHLPLFFLTVTILVSSSCSRPVSDFEYVSRYYRIKLTDTVPFVKYFSVDAMGEGQLDHNTVLWKKSLRPGDLELRKISDSMIKLCRKGSNRTPYWLMKFEEQEFTVTSLYRNDTADQYIDFRFDKKKNHATLLGLMTGKRKTRLPALLHLPDMGTFQVRSNQTGVIVDYDASRREGNEFISVRLPSATESQGSLKYSLKVTSVYPHFEGVEKDKFAGFRRNYLNLYQINPVFQVLANNSCSDPVAFTLFMSSMLALKTPPLLDSLTALDLVRTSVERYLNGMKGYGMVGYIEGYEGGEVAGWHSPVNSLDTYPSLVIAACNYIKGSNDLQWAQRYYPRIKEWMDSQMQRDQDQNGLVEYELSGNSGSWDGKVRPANWWDTIGFGFEDAFSNALTYNALNLIIMVAEMTGNRKDADSYRILADKMREKYFPTFYNPATGVLAGWKSKDGKLHDYWFLMVNSMAVYYDLVPEDKIKDIMLVLRGKMREVGYSDFSLGLPGNLIPVRKEDYTHPDPRWGGGQLEDGSDAFQRYENGGASINWSYFTLKAFQRAGLTEQNNEIADGILEGINKGAFQGSFIEGGMTKDWKSWSGVCWGYEGFLCDGYLVLLAFNPADK